MPKASGKSGYLPGAQGAYLGEKRLSDDAMRALTAQHDVEFVKYILKGQKGTAAATIPFIPAQRTVLIYPPTLGTFLVNHTHPMGNTSPSIPDVKYLIKMAEKGSPQRSSIILPMNNPATRFYQYSKTIGK